MTRALGCAVVLLGSLSSHAGAPLMTKAEAEAYARAHWFDFELAAVKDAHGGDWVAFVKAKQADERALAKEPVLRRGAAPATGDEARALRVVQQEFEAVAKHREDELRALAKQLLTALAEGRLDEVAADCTHYDASAPDRLALTRKWLEQNRHALARAAKLAKVDAPDFATSFSYSAPSPGRGMPGKVLIDFGPATPPPPNAKQRFPPGHQLELWWSGQVMPEANGPLHAKPAKTPPKSRWRLYELVLPYSRQPAYLQ